MAHKQQFCPVTGEEVNRKYHTDYQGKRIYFCSNDCVYVFNEDPERYMRVLKDQGVILEDAPEPSPSSMEM